LFSPSGTAPGHRVGVLHLQNYLPEGISLLKNLV
jgi:hypothetical protein